MIQGKGNGSEASGKFHDSRLIRIILLRLVSWGGMKWVKRFAKMVRLKEFTFDQGQKRCEKVIYFVVFLSKTHCKDVVFLSK